MDAAIVTKDSPLSVEATVARLRELVEAAGMKLFAVIDHSGEAQAHGLAALDLPLKVLIWDDGGLTRVSYAAPAELARRYGLEQELAQRLAGIGALTDRLVSAV